MTLVGRTEAVHLHLVKPIEHIAVATDFSDTAHAATDLARSLAKRWSSRVSLVHVYDPVPLGPALSYPAQVWTSDDFDEKMKERSRELLERTREARLDDVEDVGLHALHHSSPARAVCDFAEVEDADLVLTGSHGRTGLDRILLGSVAERIIRHAACSVLSVRGEVDPERFPQRVLVCTDFSPTTEPALDEGAAVAALTSAQVSLAHVYDSEPSPLLHRAPELRTPSEDATLEEALRSALAGLSDERFDGRAAVVLLDSTAPAQTLADYASAHRFDLVVVATHGRTGLSRMLVGSVAEKVARLASAPVWIARTPEDVLQ